MTAALPNSSGDPALDRRLDWARAYLEAGDRDAGTGLLEDLVAEAPRFAAAWFLLGEAREAGGGGAAAVAAYERVLALDGQDRLGAGLRLARLGARPAERAMSHAFVRTLFDQYADRFDTALRAGLAYRGPEVLAEAVAAWCAAHGRPARFARMLDLGCGTGLAAPLFAPLCAELVGVDLSAGMVQRAQALGLYRRLAVDDMVAFLDAEPAHGAELAVAADAFCYLDDLVPVLAAARQALRPGGLMAFTVETHAGAGLVLRGTLRYAHGAALVRACLAGADFADAAIAEVSTRTEKGAPVPGLVVVARAGRGGSGGQEGPLQQGRQA